MKQSWELSGSWPCINITATTQPKEQTCLRENGSSKRAVLLIISIGFTVGLTIFMLNMPNSPQTCQDYFSSRALTEQAQKQIKTEMVKPKYRWVPVGHHLAAVRHHSREATWGHAWRGTLPRCLQEHLRSPWAQMEKGAWEGCMKRSLWEIVQLLYTDSFRLLSVQY